MNSNTFLGLAMVVVGGVLIYAAFQTPPDPRNVLAAAFGAKVPTSIKPTQTTTSPRSTRGI
jgi:hypothetical protein